jgi:hypothetical protein
VSGRRETPDHSRVLLQPPLERNLGSHQTRPSPRAASVLTHSVRSGGRTTTVVEWPLEQLAVTATAGYDVRVESHTVRDRGSRAEGIRAGRRRRGFGARSRRGLWGRAIESPGHDGAISAHRFLRFRAGEIEQISPSRGLAAGLRNTADSLRSPRLAARSKICRLRVSSLATRGAMNRSPESDSQRADSRRRATTATSNPPVHEVNRRVRRLVCRALLLVARCFADLR